MFKRALGGMLALAVAMGSLVAAPAPALAVAEADYSAAARSLGKYGIVRGDDRGYRFYDQITRAELAKVLVYSLGLETEAPRYAGRGYFSDTYGHWADGPISLARNQGIMQGYPEGNFRPENPLTYAEVVTALSRFVGLEASREPWPWTYLEPAARAGIVPGDMELNNRLGTSATRGDVFVLLWRALTVVKNYDGQNMLRRYLDARPPVLTVDPQPQETQDLTLVVSGTADDAATVLVNGQKADLAYGAFRQPVELRVGPNSLRIQAVDDAGNVAEQTVQVTRLQSPPGTVSLRGPSSVAAGESAAFTVDLRDQNGQVVASRTGMTATIAPEGLGTFDPVRGQFTAGSKPGAGVITLQAGNATASLPVLVVAGPLDRLSIQPAEVALDAGGTATFMARGVDRFGNEVPVSGIQWHASGGTISQSGLFQAPVTAGTFTVTATAAGKSGTAMVQPPNFRVDSITLTQPVAYLKANGLSELTLTATLKDAAGAVVTNYSGSLNVSSSLPGVAAPAQTTVAVVNGVAQIPVRAGSTPGTARITVSNWGKSAAANVVVDAQRLQSVRLTATATPSVSTWATGYVEAIAQDEDGNPMRSDLGQTLLVDLSIPEESGAVFMSNESASAFVALERVNPETGDVRSRIYVRYPAGTGTFPIEGVPAPASMSWVRVIPGALRADQVGMPARLRIEPLVDGVSGQNQFVYVNVLDADGYRVTQSLPLSGVVVTLQDQHGFTWPVDPPAQAEPGRIRFRVNQMLAGTYTYTATMQPTYAVATATHTVRAGAPTGVRWLESPAVLPADNTSQLTLRAELVDAAGNRVTSPAHRATFSLTNNEALKSMPDQTVTTVNGVAELKVTAGTVVGWDDVTITVATTGAPLTATKRVTTTGTPHRLSFPTGAIQGQAGQPLVIQVDVVDQNGGLAAYDNGRSVTLTLRNLTTQAETKLGAQATKDGRVTFSTTLKEAGTYALKAESGTLLKALSRGYGGSAEDISVQAGRSFGFRVNADITTLQRDSGASYALVSVEMMDANGNPTTNQTGSTMAVTLEFPTGTYTSGYFTVDDSTTGTKTWTRTVLVAPGDRVSGAVRFFSGSLNGQRTITAKTLDGTSGQITIQTADLGTAAKAAFVAIQPVSVTAAQEVVVNAVNTGGTRVSSYTGSIALRPIDPDVTVTAWWDASANDWNTDLAAAVADRGQIRFRVTATVPGTKVYEASLGAEQPAVTTGRFNP